jgi:hypothetical protein
MDFAWVGDAGSVCGEGVQAGEVVGQHGEGKFAGYAVEASSAELAKIALLF